MQINFDKYDELAFIVGNSDTVKNMTTVCPLKPFSDEVIVFLSDLAKIAMPRGKEYSDVSTFGFWCRHSAIIKEKNKYDDISQRLGRGVVFHSTPSNVPVNFAFSLATGLLSGNANIVRLPAKNFEQTRIICGCIKELIADSHKNMAPYVCMIKYPPIQEITDAFSSICDTRVIWGGDATIKEIRQSPLKPRATEITFADRHSIAVINADEYINADNKGALAQYFYNDTYFSDQNACTAPRILVWLGNNINIAKKIFWQKIHDIVKEKYSLAPVQSVGKLSAFYRVASKKNVRLVNTEDALVMRVSISNLDDSVMDYKYNSGFFFEYDAKQLCDILPLCSERCQTMTYYGLSQEELKKFFLESSPRGVDRAVPLGQSMDFTLVWDGYDMIRTLSRKITIL